MRKIGALIILSILIGACEVEKEVKEEKLFQTVTADQSGVDFINQLTETEECNYYQYIYNYIGAGVAASDFNQDGKIDLFFVSNFGHHKLYLNKGDFLFEDITASSGIQNVKKGFSTGVAVVDINNDGLSDLYISRGGPYDEPDQLTNQLYINNGDLTFTERAAQYGIEGGNRSVQSTFFDYDLDGDLDLYVANTPNIKGKTKKILDLKEIQNNPATLQQRGTDQLYRNDGEIGFVNVSTEAGLLPELGFGLNAQIGDFNEDGWPDIYVCNDFKIPDFIYLNNQDGTFREGRDEVLKHMSFSSMGADYADINNDGHLDLMTLDMNPEDYIRSKTTMGMTSVSAFEEMVAKSYHYQYMHNNLQLNRGGGKFSEIANLSGVANTDWSWAVLLADFNLDGLNDAYITNGIYRDVMDVDKNREIMGILRKNRRRPTKSDFLKFTQMLPQQKLQNYLFKNNADLTFDNVTNEWSDSLLTFSNGAAYADLDNDGDLDLIVNNINDEATLLRNQSVEQHTGNYLLLAFEGPENNKMGLGVKVKLNLKSGGFQIKELVSTRGYLSSSPDMLHFGFKPSDSIRSLEVIWPDHKIQTIQDITHNQKIVVNYSEAIEESIADQKPNNPLFKKVDIGIHHTEKPYNDYNKQVLLPKKLSQTGPAVAKADLNKDGFTDLYIGGAAGFEGKLYLGTSKGGFLEVKNEAFIYDQNHEDVAAEFLDYDNDGDLDLYVASGSYEFDAGSHMLLDRLYTNLGDGIFQRDREGLPEMKEATSVVRSSDFDQDGDVDLFVGSRVIPGQYPVSPRSFLLTNDGGRYVIKTSKLSPGLEYAGMITDAQWVDFNNDDQTDLVVTGEWIGIEVFINDEGYLKRSEKYKALSSATGWWNTLNVADTDGDGDLDIIAGNVGLNIKHHASYEKPFHVYAKDFDQNGTQDVFLAKYYKDKQVPVRGKTCSSQQLPGLKQTIPTYNDFASRDIKGVLGDGIENALHLNAVEFRSGIFMNDQQGFHFVPFSSEALVSPVSDLLYEDLDGDGMNDLLLVGNDYSTEVETTRLDAGAGVFLKGLGNGNFQYLSNEKTEFYANKDARKVLAIQQAGNQSVLVINNDSGHDYFRIIEN